MNKVRTENLDRYLKYYRKHLQLLIFSGGGNDILDANLPPLLNKMLNRPGFPGDSLV